jgi:hypothetical protein
MDTFNIQEVRAHRSVEENRKEKQLKVKNQVTTGGLIPQLPQEIIDSILFKWGGLEHPFAKKIKKECCKSVEKRMNYYCEEQVNYRVKYWSKCSSMNGWGYGRDGVIFKNPDGTCHRCRVYLCGEAEGVLRVQDILLWTPKRHMNGKRVVCDCGNRKLAKGDWKCWVCCESDLYTSEDYCAVYGFHKDFPRFRYF